MPELSGLSLPDPAAIPGAALLLSLFLIAASWWFVHLLFSWMSQQGDLETDCEAEPEGEEAAPAGVLPAMSPADSAAAQMAVAETAAAEMAAADSPADPPPPDLPAAAPRVNHWGEDFSPPEDLPPPGSAEPTGDSGQATQLAGDAVPGPQDLARIEQVEERLTGFRDLDGALALSVGAVRDALESAAVAVWVNGTPPSVEVADSIGGFSPQASHQAGFCAPDSAAPLDLRGLFVPWAGALAAGETVCIPDCAAEPDLCGRLRAGIGSLVLAPFPKEVTLPGGLAVGWAAPLSIGPHEFAVTRRLAREVGMVLDLARLQDELAVRRTQARVLVETGIVLSGVKDAREMLSSILHVVHDRLGYQAVAVLLVDEEKDELYIARMAGYAPAVRGLRVSLSSGAVTATAARERRIVNVPEVGDWPGYIAGSDTVRSELALPLVVDGRTLGVLDVESEQPARFDRRDVATLEAVASQAALVLAHARLLARLEERAARLQTVDEMARAVSITLDARSLFHIVVEQVRAIVGCDRATLVNFDAEKQEAQLVALSSIRPIDGLEVGTALPLSGLPEEERTLSGATYVPDVEAGEVGCPHLRGSGFRSQVRVPIHIDGKVAGILTASSLQPDAFTPAQVATLAAVAPHVSAALRNARLYEQVERSYRQLNEAHGQLVQSEQLRVLGEMASGVAHNFNNVLGAILGRAQFVRARLEDPQLAREIAVIEQAATDGAATVRRLQEFTRVRADREFVPVDLSQIARDALALTRPWWKESAEAGGVRYDIASDLADGAWVEGQAHELREVAMNVVLNAVEAMPSGGSLTLRSRSAQGRVSLEITDTGVGMSDEVRSRIFHPFYSTKGPRGTGLGLSIAYGIVQRHGGVLELDSRLGAGTTVRISLPATDREGNQAPAAPELVTAPFQASVLVVEDEPAVASLLEELLVAAGYSVTVARTGREAVECLLDSQFHLVLTDLGLPEMSGWELARHCRDLYQELPVVLVTGWGVELDEDQVRETGVRWVISKPFGVTEVLETVSRLLESNQEQRQAA